MPHVTPAVEGFFHPLSGSIAYLVKDPPTRLAPIIDPVLDLLDRSARVSTESADGLNEAVMQQGSTVELVLDTHIHADHLSAADYLRTQLDVPVATGDQVPRIQRHWKAIYDFGDFSIGGSAWGRLLANGDRFAVGELSARIMRSAGHAPGSVTYVIGDAAFVHDTMFMPVMVTARPRPAMGEHRRRAATAQHSPGRQDRNRVRRAALLPGRRPNGAATDALCPAGQSAGRTIATAGGKRPVVPEETGQRPGIDHGE